MKSNRAFTIRRITMLALLSALACVGRMMLASIPNVQPVTVMLLIITLEMGIVDGIIVATLSMILSNIFLGMGPWTIYQIASFAIVIICFSLLKPLWSISKTHPWIRMGVFAFFAGLSGYVYGFVISIFSVYLYHMTNFWVYYLQGLSYDTMHAIGNIGFWMLLVNLLPPLLQRQQKKGLGIN